MRLKLTLLRSDNSMADVIVTTTATATVGEVAATIAASDPHPSRHIDADAPATLYVHRPGASQAEFLMPSRPLAEAKVGSGLIVSVVELDPARDWSRERLPESEVVLRVIDGPDRGARFILESETVWIGRQAGVDIVLSDSSVSKRHARIELEAEGITVIDNNSANGIEVDGGRVSRVFLLEGARFAIGATLLEVESVVRTRAIDPASSSDVGAPHAFVRRPRVEARFPGETLDAPELPSRPRPQPFPWLVMIAPLLLGGILFAVTQSVLSIIFVALSPVLMAASWTTQFLERRRTLREQIADFRQEIATLEQRVVQLAEQERQVRLAESPALASIIDDARSRGPLLWARRPEQWSFLTVRLGLGTSRSRTQIEKRPAGQRSLPGFREEVDELRERTSRIGGVPIIESLTVAGGFGVAGHWEAVHWYARGIVAQLALLHSPSELVLAGFADLAHVDDVEWMKWLPHATSPHSPISVAPFADNAASAQRLLNELEAIIAERSAAAGPRAPGDREQLTEEESIEGIAQRSGTGDDDVPTDRDLPTIVVVVAGTLSSDRGRLTALMERGARLGVHVVWLASDLADIPAVCRSFCEIPSTQGASPTAGFVREGRRVALEAVEGLDRATAEGIARDLASVSDAGSFRADESDLPRSVSFLGIIGTELAHEPAAVVDRWHQNGSLIDRSRATTGRRSAGSLRAIIGMAGADAMTLDLRSQGPHALVGGTTGSGKSEFLQAWVLGMAAEYSPDRLTFLFVDYKGGSAFADCVNLPHCVGLVTDLTTHLVRRALTSLRAEIHHREHLFNAKKVKDIIDFEKSGDPDCPPALIIVIDEFAALATEIPEFVDGVVDVAQRGRSLGIHLIMATQRPAGVIKDNLRANTNLRVALRMSDESDSTDVIGSPVAASFDPAVPGRGIAKFGPGRLVPFQTGYAGGWTTDEPEAAAVEISTLVYGEGIPWEAPPRTTAVSDERGPNDTARLVTTMTAAAAAASVRPPRKPWLDELSPLYDLAELRQRSDDALVLGVVDDPARQSQEVVYFRPDVEGSIAFYGTGGSGKSTALRTLATAAAITPKGGPVHVYALDFAGGGLRSLEVLPHVGAVIAGDDDERISRLFGMLRELVDERAERFSTARASSIVEYRRIAKRPDEPRILVLVDGMAAFRQEYEYSGTGGLFTVFQQLLADGRQVGLHFVVAADRPGSISPSVSSLIQRKIAMRLADENDYLLVDAPTDILGSTSVPGRAIIDGLEAQIAVLGGSRSIAQQSDELEQLARSMLASGVAPAPTVQRLATEIPLETLPAVAGALVLGVADDTLQPVGIEPEGVFMLTGPPVSGRTTALQVIAASLRRVHPDAHMVYVGTPKSPVAHTGMWAKRALSVDETAALAKELLPTASGPVGASGPLVIVIEGISEFLGTVADAELLALIKAARRNGHVVVAESESSTWSQSWPLLVEVKSARRGMALQPDVMEGELLFKTPFPRARRADFPPGRGWLVEAGKVRKVQLALPPA
jgi:S-DNA-T family DNA segregation ATPase FtsK/SpoIIIE